MFLLLWTALSSAALPASVRAADEKSQPIPAKERQKAGTEPEAVPMSLETAVLFAVNNNPDIKINQAVEEQWKHAAEEAGSAYYPQVGASVRSGREYNAPATFKVSPEDRNKSALTNSYDASLNVSQMIYDGDQTSEEVARRKQLQTSASIEKKISTEKIIVDTAKAYLDVYRYQKTLAEAEAFLGRMQEIKKKVNLMMEAGAESKAKAKYVESRLSYAEAEKNGAAASLATAKTDLELLTGHMPEFEANLPSIKDLLAIQLSEYLKIAAEKNTQVALNHSDKTVLQHELEKNEGKYLPTLSFLMNATQNYDVGGEIGRDRAASAMFQVNYSIFDGFARDATRKRIRSQIDETEFRKEKIQRDIQQKIKSSYNQMSALEQDYAIAEQEIKSSEDLQALYGEQLNYGEGDIINLIEGEERLYQARARIHSIDANMALTALKMLSQLGVLDKNKFCSSC